MPQRFCPFGFFSFYVNKKSAEAGGCHQCVEHACALWDNSEAQCSVKSALDSVSIIADSFSSGRGLPIAGIPSAPAKEAKGGLSNIMDKLRAKKKLPSAKKSTENKVEKKPDAPATAQTPTATPTKPAETKTDETKTPETKTNIVNPALLPTAEKPGQVSKSEPAAPEKVETKDPNPESKES